MCACVFFAHLRRTLCWLTLFFSLKTEFLLSFNVYLCDRITKGKLWTFSLHLSNNVCSHSIFWIEQRIFNFFAILSYLCVNGKFCGWKIPEILQFIVVIVVNCELYCNASSNTICIADLLWIFIKWINYFASVSIHFFKWMMHFPLNGKPQAKHKSIKWK